MVALLAGQRIEELEARKDLRDPEGETASEEAMDLQVHPGLLVLLVEDRQDHLVRQAMQELKE